MRFSYRSIASPLHDPTHLKSVMRPYEGILEKLGGVRQPLDVIEGKLDLL